MKMRTLHPDFFTDSTLALLSYEARLLYAGLWCHSDDYGRGRWLPKRIEGEVFPHDDVDIEVLLESLVDAGLIVQYSHPGKSGQDRFYFIPNWEKYQSPKYRAKTSIPEPSDETPGQTDPGQLGTNLEPTPGQIAQEIAPGEGEGEGEEVEDIAPQPAQTIHPDSTTLNDLKATLVALCGEPPPHHWSVYNRVATWIRDQGGDVGELRLKAGLIVEEWGRKALTVTSIEKHWTRYDAEVGQLSDEDVKRYQAEVRRQKRRKEIHGT